MSVTGHRRYRYSCVALEKWIRSKTNIIIGSGSREEVQYGPTLPPPTRDDPLWISPLKYPDVSLWYDNEVTLQIEVVSNYDLEKTINKLCLGLIPQHRSWKNRLSSISYIVGFIFPVQNDSKTVDECGQCVHRVSLCWIDQSFQYLATVTPLTARQVWNEVRDAKRRQQQQLQSLQNLPNAHFTLPMTESYIKNNFSLDAYQVKSGESVVILTTTNAYKRCFGVKAMQQLIELRDSNIIFQSYTACAFPLQTSLHKFYVFLRYGKPLTRDQIVEGNFQHLYINAVIESLNILHEEAHLDIRIENICWDDQSRAIFIDLDRSAGIDACAEEYIGWYGKSLMYPITSKWTTKQVDYRQIAILIGHIEGNDQPHQVPPDLTSLFIQKLYNEGKCTLNHCFFVFVFSYLVCYYCWRCIPQVFTVQIYMNNGTHHRHI